MRRCIAPLVVAGLLVSCQTIVRPPPTATPGESAALGSPTLPPLPPQATSPVVGSVGGSWTKLADMPTGRSGAAATVFDGRIVLIGGLGAPKSVERYDPATKIWDQMPDLPFGVDHAMAASIENSVNAGIFVFGGFQNGQPSDRSWYLPRDVEDWREINHMPAIRLGGAAVTIDKKIYIVAGSTTQRGASPQATFVFDIDSGWTQKASIPTARNNLGAALVGGKVCAFGGRELLLSRNISAAECYDPQTDKWESLPPLPSPRGGIAAAAVGDRVVVAGGEEVAGVIRQVDVYDSKARAWSRGPDLPTARQDLSLATVGKTVYAIAGGGASITNSQFRTVEAWTLP